MLCKANATPFLLIAVLTLGLNACSANGKEAAKTDGDALETEVEEEDDRAECDEPSEGESFDLDTADGDTDAEPEENEWELDSADPDQSETDSPTNRALVFPIDPVATPEPVYTTLRADESSGALLSPADTNKLRRLAVYSCADLGATNTINIGQGPVSQRICTLVQRADKMTHGDYVYDDYANAVSGGFDPDDTHAEIEAFFHAAKFYEFFTSPEVGLFDTIPNAHGDGNLPINLVTNYQMPAPASSQALLPTRSAMYFPRENLAMGMGMVYGLTGVSGDIIALGQGIHADFAYDGQTIYHEMGHLMNRALSNLKYTITLDSYGMNALENALEQGLAETMTFLVSDRSGMFRYIDRLEGPGFFRDADNDLSYPADYCGKDQADAMILAGAMWEVYGALQSEGVTTPQFTRLLLLSMQTLDANTAELSFADWADAFLADMEMEGRAAQKTAVAAIFEKRGLFISERVRPLPANSAGIVLYIGGAYKAMWNTVLTLDLDTGDLPVSTALVQLKAGPFDHDTACTLSAKPNALSGSESMYPSVDDWDLRLFARSAEPIRYETVSSWRARVAYDTQIEALTDGTGSVSFPLTFSAGKALYLHLVNAGDSPIFLTSIRLTCP